MAGFLGVIAVGVCCPRSGRAQAMTRDNPALHSSDTGSGAANADADHSDDPTVRPPPTDVVGGGPYLGRGGVSTAVVDLTGGRETIVTTERVKFRPIFYLNTTLAYNDNIFIRPVKTGDFVTTFEPGVIFAAGDFRDVLPRLGNIPHVYAPPADDTLPQRYVYLDYHPTFYIFAKNGQQDAVDESVSLLGGYAFPKLLLNGDLQYLKLSSEDLDAGKRVDRSFYMGNVTSTYTYSDKTSLEFNFYANDREYPDPYVSSTEVINRDYIDYLYGPKTSLSAGVAFGHISYDTSADQTYEQFLLRLTRMQLVKIDFTVEGGLDYRENSSGGDMATGIFDLNATFRPYDGTSLSFIASRDIEPSALRNDVITYTRVGISAQQRLLYRIYLTLQGTYANAVYKAVADVPTPSRKDDSEELDVTLDTDVTRYASIQVSYVFRNDASSSGERTFTQNIGSFKLQLTY